MIGIENAIVRLAEATEANTAAQTAHTQALLSIHGSPAAKPAEKPVPKPAVKVETPTPAPKAETPATAPVETPPPAPAEAVAEPAAEPAAETAAAEPAKSTGQELRDRVGANLGNDDVELTVQGLKDLAIKVIAEGTPRTVVKGYIGGIAGSPNKGIADLTADQMKLLHTKLTSL